MGMMKKCSYIFPIIILILIFSSCRNFPPEKKGVTKRITSFDSTLFRIDENNQYALIIGIDHYERLENLNNVVFDAKELKNLLIERYKYRTDNIIELYDREATQANIESRLRELIDRLTPVDNLLVYFSGHGHLDEDFSMGFWLPSDFGTDLGRGQQFTSEEEVTNPSNLKVSNANLKGFMKNCKAHHIFVMVDVCFSGHLLVGRGVRIGEKIILNPKYLKKKSRQVLASGTERVSDGMLEEHSPLAKYFLKCLKDKIEQYMMAQKVIGDVMTAVSRDSDQALLGGTAKYVGDEGGQFVFLFKYFPQVNQLKTEYVTLLDELNKPEINRKNKTRKCKSFLKNIQSFFDSSMIQQMKADVNKWIKRLTHEIEQIEKMKTAHENLISHLKNTAVDVTKKLEECRAFLDKFKDAPADSEVVNMRSIIIESIAGLKLEAMEQEFQALVRFQSNQSPGVGEKLEKWRDFKTKYTEMSVPKTLQSIISKANDFIKQLEEQLGNQYKNLETVVKDEKLSYEKRIDACQKFLKDNERVLTDQMEMKIAGYIQKLKDEKREKTDYERQQEVLDYGSLRNNSTLKGYLDFVKKYPRSIQIQKLKRTLKAQYKNLPPEKYWENISENTQKYWEEEFENHHIMVWIPELNGWVDKYEISNQQWKQYSMVTLKKVTTMTLGNMKNYIRDYPGYPVLVTFEEALGYCKAYGLKLLSAREWMISAGKSRGIKYPWGNDPLQSGKKFKANSDNFDDTFPNTAPVTSLSEYPSPFGLVNMGGNADEWVRSKNDNKKNLLKGGGYLSKLKAFEIKSNEPAEELDTGGFRCIRYESEIGGKK